jgi:molybdate transport system ATP-binding protein
MTPIHRQPPALALQPSANATSRQAGAAPIEASLRMHRRGFTLDVDLRLPGQGVSVLLGPSGCGKTTVLRCLAGLERATGSVRVGDETWQDHARGLHLPTHRRALGMVFQEASLFAHLSVADNLLYGFRRIPAAQRRIQPDQAIQLLGIGHLMDRETAGLSGGERQRVAIARALLTSPALLLMDEPLSALDVARKAEVLPYLSALSDSGVPIVYVTHSLDEAARLADHLVLMRAGRVELAGPADEVMARPDSPLARLDDASAILHATLIDQEPESGLARLRLGQPGQLGADEGSVLWVGGCNEAIGARVRVRVLARDVSVALSRAHDSSILNILPATVDALHEEDAASVMLRLRTADGSALLARLTRRSVTTLGLKPGMNVHAQIKGAALLRG